MLELAAASGEIELKYHEGVRLLSVESGELYLFPARATQADGTNSATRSQTEYFGAHSTLSQLCVRFSAGVVYKQVLSQNDGIAGTISLKTLSGNGVHQCHRSRQWFHSHEFLSAAAMA